MLNHTLKTTQQGRRESWDEDQRLGHMQTAVFLRQLDRKHLIN